MRYVITGIIAAAISFGATAAHAKSTSIIGSWSGSGVTKGNSGKQGTARCDMVYRKGSGSSYSMEATCTVSSIGLVSQTASVKKVGANRYSGKFHNFQHNVSGSISVVLRGKSQSVTMSSPRGRATVKLAKH